MGDTLISTQQALRVVSRRFPGIRTARQLLRQVKVGALCVVARHGRKNYFRLADVMEFTPSYKKQGRNARPPLWTEPGLTISEAAAMLGLTRTQVRWRLRKLGIMPERVANALRLTYDDFERLRRGGERS